MIQLTDIKALISVGERLAMVEAIWEDIKKEDISLSASQRNELDRRLTLHKNGEMPYHSWEDIKRNLHDR